MVESVIARPAARFLSPVVMSANTYSSTDGEKFRIQHMMFFIRGRSEAAREIFLAQILLRRPPKAR